MMEHRREPRKNKGTDHADRPGEARPRAEDPGHSASQARRAAEAGGARFDRQSHRRPRASRLTERANSIAINELQRVGEPRCRAGQRGCAARPLLGRDARPDPGGAGSRQEIRGTDLPRIWTVASHHHGLETGVGDDASTAAPCVRNGERDPLAHPFPRSANPILQAPIPADITTLRRIINEGLLSARQPLQADEPSIFRRYDTQQRDRGRSERAFRFLQTNVRRLAFRQ